MTTTITSSKKSVRQAISKWLLSQGFVQEEKNKLSSSSPREYVSVTFFKDEIEYYTREYPSSEGWWCQKYDYSQDTVNRLRLHPAR